jgi:hypothetical protein
VANLDEAASGFSDTPIADESVGTAMLYSSGTTGRPKGILRPLAEGAPAQNLPIFDFIMDAWRFGDGMTYIISRRPRSTMRHHCSGLPGRSAWAAPRSSWSISIPSSSWRWSSAIA